MQQCIPIKFSPDISTTTSIEKPLLQSKIESYIRIFAIRLSHRKSGLIRQCFFQSYCVQFLSTISNDILNSFFLIWEVRHSKIVDNLIQDCTLLWVQKFSSDSIFIISLTYSGHSPSSSLNSNIFAPNTCSLLFFPLIILFKTLGMLML